MPGEQIIYEALSKLQRHVEKSAFRGYDPYDLLRSKIPFNKFGRQITFVFSQANKRSPINLRPLLLIRKDVVPKGLAILLRAYCILYKVKPTMELREKTEYLYQKLINCTVNGFSGNCWGINFDYANRHGIVPKNTPSSVVTHFVHAAIYDYYKLFPVPDALKILKGCGEFILRDLFKRKWPEGLCFSYTPIAKDCVYNANGHCAEVLSRNYALFGDMRLKKVAEDCVRFIVSRQKIDGSWNYGVDEEGREKKQIDFHQGFLIDSIMTYIKYTGDDNREYLNAVDKAASFYLNKQFFPNGQSLWRYPKVWPVDIHNQAQGIITFCNLYSYNKAFGEVAKTIVNWTIANMQDKSGFFYYQKYRFFTNRIDYIRWGQAWMLYALAVLIKDNLHNSGLAKKRAGETAH